MTRRGAASLTAPNLRAAADETAALARGGAPKTAETYDPPMEMGRPSLLWVASHLRHPSGHAEEARSTLRALEEQGFEPSAIELSKLDGEQKTIPLSEGELAVLVRQIERAPTDPVVAIHAYTPKPERRYSVPAAANVARTMFETDRLPDGWAELSPRRTRSGSPPGTTMRSSPREACPKRS